MTVRSSISLGPLSKIPLLLLGACAPIAAPMPFSTLQRADALQPGQHAVTAAVGAGMTAVGWPEGGWGGALQVRHSIAGRVELEGDGQAISYSCDNCADNYKGQHISFAGRGGIKYGLGKNVAVIGGLGYAGGAGGHAIGMDSGLVVNLGSMLYWSGRLGVAVPADFSDEIDTTPTTTYETTTLGFRAHGNVAFISELGVGAIQAGDKTGGAMFLSVGIDME
jgi:hypothetical protein